MAVTAHINLVRSEGDVDRRIARELSQPSYDEFLEITEVLASATKTQIYTNIGTIKMIYVDSDGDTVRIYKNDESQYWEFDHLFFAFDCDASKIELYAATGATVHVFLGGE